MLTFTNSHGVRFNVRVVKRGQARGRGDRLIHDRADPLVQFFDASRPIEEPPHLGVLAGDYFASTLRQNRRQLEESGLCLCTQEPTWVVDAELMQRVFKLPIFRRKKHPGRSVAAGTVRKKAKASKR